MPTLIIPTPLRKFTGQASKIAVEGNNVDQVLQALINKYPDIRKHLMDPQDKVRPFINIFVGEEHIRNMQEENTPVGEAAVISIVPAIAGG